MPFSQNRVYSQKKTVRNVSIPQLFLHNDVGIGFFDAWNRMDFGHNKIGEFSIIRGVDETEDVRLAETGMSLLNSREGLKNLEYILGSSSFDFHEDVSFGRHNYLLVQKSMGNAHIENLTIVCCSTIDGVLVPLPSPSYCGPSVLASRIRGFEEISEAGILEIFSYV